MTKKNQSKKIKDSKVNNEDCNKMDRSDNLEVVKTSTIIGYETENDILNEVNSRLQLINKSTLLLKHIPKQLTKRSLKQLIPDMVTCRFTLSKNKLNSGFAFVQMKTTDMVDKYIKKINESEISNHRLMALKVKEIKPLVSLKGCDMKCLFFNGLKPEAKASDIKEAYPNANIIFPVNKDKSARGSMTLVFNTENEAKEAFAENKLTLNGIKVQLNYLIKKKIDEIFSFERPDEIIAEIKKRYEALRGRSIVIKMMGIQFSVNTLKNLLPQMRSCKINADKKMIFVNFATCELTTEAQTILSSQKMLKSFVAKIPNLDFIDISQFDPQSLHLSNLTMDTTTEDIQSVFGKCKVDLPVNEDNTCTGSATLTFTTKEECLSQFTKTDVTIKNVPININFKRITKTENRITNPKEMIKAIAPEKRKFVDNDTEKETTLKKSKVANNNCVTKVVAKKKTEIEVVKTMKRKIDETEDGSEMLSKKPRTSLKCKKAVSNMKNANGSQIVDKKTQKKTTASNASESRKGEGKISHKAMHK